MTRGFTLVEFAVAIAAAALLVSLALPGANGAVRKSRRMDAQAALTRVQFAQERYHALYGTYAAELRVLDGARSPVSDGGLYDIRIDGAAADAYAASAVARSDAAQRDDTACGRITVSIAAGVADYGPSAVCWNR